MGFSMLCSMSASTGPWYLHQVIWQGETAGVDVALDTFKAEKAFPMRRIRERYRSWCSLEILSLVQRVHELCMKDKESMSGVKIGSGLDELIYQGNNGCCSFIFP